jgi:DNA-binding beta-propeller fold protein YncE
MVMGTFVLVMDAQRNNKVSVAVPQGLIVLKFFISLN